MDSKVGSTVLQTFAYDDFEPFGTWQREEGQDTLVLHLQEFKKDQLRIQISNGEILKITGERPLDGKKCSRFQKEIKVTKDYNSNNIHAKFSQGHLRVTLPKKVLTPSQLEPPSASPQDDRGSKDVIPNLRERPGQVLRSKRLTQVAVNIGFAVVVAFTVYVAYKYWTMYVQVDED